MGMLVDGKWHDVWYETKETGGQFVRAASQFRNFITADGSPGPTGTRGRRCRLVYNSRISRTKKNGSRTDQRHRTATAGSRSAQRRAPEVSLTSTPSAAASPKSAS